MIIKKIILNNIRSYENEEIEFPLGSTVLAGDIGSGKTSVLLAIEFALFGLQPGQKGAALLRNGKDQGSVTLEIEIDGKVTRFERGLKKGKSVTQDYAILETEEGKKEISATELKNKILELLSYPKEFAKKTNLLYRFTVYTPQEEMKEIILESAETRINTLRYIFGIDKYKRIKENTEILTAKLREQIRGKEGEIKDLSELKKKLEERKEAGKQIEISIELLEKETAERKKIRQEAEKSLEEIKIKIEEKTNFEKEIEKTRIMLIAKNELMSSIEKEKIELKKQIEELQSQLNKAPEIKKLEEAILSMKKEIDNLKLSQASSESELKELESKIKEKQKYEQEIEKANIMLRSKNEMQSNNDKEISFIIKQLEETKSLLFNPQEIEKLEAEIIQNEKSREEKNKAYLELSGQISSCIKKISELEESKLNIAKLKHCPTCFQDVAEDYKSNVSRKFEDDIFRYKKEASLLEAEKEKISKEIDYLSQSLINQRKIREELKEKKAKLENAEEKKAKLLELEKRKTAFEKDIELLISQEKTFKESASLLKKYDLLYEQKKKENQELVLKERQINLEIISIQRDRDKQVSQKEKIIEKEQKSSELDNKKIMAEKDVSILEKQIDTLKESVSALKKYDSLYELKEKEVKGLFKSEKEKEIELGSKKREKEILAKITEELSQGIEKKEKIKEALLSLTELEGWLSSSFLNIISLTEKNIMLKLKEEFSKLFNEWFNILVPEIFSVRLDEYFTPIIEQQDYELEYSFLSGGERTAIALAYRLALNQIINSLLSKIKTHDLVILDEPTDGFSEQQLDKMRDVLSQLKVKQLIIVSHESKIESFVEHIIKFRKEAGITKVER